MKMKGFSKVALLVVVLIGCSVLGVKLSVANEKKVYIFNDQLRKEMVNGVSWSTGETVENELPTVKQLEKVNGVSFFNASSIEGIQYAKNVTELVFAGEKDEETNRSVIDLRPIGELTNLEFLQCYSYVPESELDFLEQDISYISNLKKLRSLDLYDFPVIDITPLSELKNLERFDITHGAFPMKVDSVAVSKIDRTCILEQPVKYSTQLDGGTQTVKCVDREQRELSDLEVKVDGKKLTIEDIPDDMEQIFLLFYASSIDKHFYVRFFVEVPIFWY